MITLALHYLINQNSQDLKHEKVFVIIVDSLYVPTTRLGSRKDIGIRFLLQRKRNGSHA